MTGLEIVLAYIGFLTITLAAMFWLAPFLSVILRLLAKFTRTIATLGVIWIAINLLGVLRKTHQPLKNMIFFTMIALGIAAVGWDLNDLFKKGYKDLKIKFPKFSRKKKTIQPKTAPFPTGT